MKQKIRNEIPDKNRIVIKVGSSSLTHPSTGKLDLKKLEVLVRELTDLSNQGKDVVLVSSGAVMVGWSSIGLPSKPHVLSRKQACASVGQARLIMIYQKLFSEYNQLCSQILLTKNTVNNETSRNNARNTFEELFDLRAIPIVNENDTVSTQEIEFGDNDTLSAVVASLIDADLLILLSDIDGLYTADPNVDPEAVLIEQVDSITDEMEQAASGSRSKVGTGGMKTKLQAAKIANQSGCDMIIANGKDFHIISDLLAGENLGTYFKSAG